MENCVEPKVRRYKWHKLLIVGIVTYVLGLIVLIGTGNIVLFPAVVMLGNFLIPVIYVAFFYEKRRISHVTMTDTVASFFYGGFLGTFAAAVLEPIFMTQMSMGNALIVGLVEEFTKILGVLLIYKRKKCRFHIDGIILGASAGMGFAALESTGYAFSYFLRSQGNLSLTVYITLLRGILSPLGHGTWTAILGGVFARENTNPGLRINRKIVNAYIVVVILHSLWNSVPSLMSVFFPLGASIFLAEIIIGIIGIIILRVQWYRAKKALS